MSGLPEDDKKPSFRDYFAGASISFGLVTIVWQIFGTILSYMGFGSQASEQQAGVAFALYMTLHLTFGWMGGYLVARRALDGYLGYLRAGLLTGFGAYLLEFAMMMLLQLSFPGGLWALLGFLAGGSLGGLTLGLLRSRLRGTKAPSTSSPPTSPT